MSGLIHERFLLQSDEAVRLYFDHAADLPVIDFHTHLPPGEIAAADAGEALGLTVTIDDDRFLLRGRGLRDKAIDRAAADPWQELGLALQVIVAAHPENEDVIIASINKKGARVFVLPGLLKITVTSVAAKPARKGTNPFTGEPTTFKAKPATVKVKVRPMKKLKDAAKA